MYRCLCEFPPKKIDKDFSQKLIHTQTGVGYIFKSWKGMKLNIRARLTLQFTYIVTFILILFSFIIYYFSASYRESEFYSHLGKTRQSTQPNC